MITTSIFTTTLLIVWYYRGLIVSETSLYISLFFFIFAFVRLTKLYYRYYHYQVEFKIILKCIKMVVSELCIESNKDNVECTIVNFRKTESFRRSAYYSRIDKKIYLEPYLGLMLRAEHFDYVGNIIIIAAHEFCHYLQDLNSYPITKKESENDAKDIAKMYLLYHRKRIEPKIMEIILESGQYREKIK